MLTALYYPHTHVTSRVILKNALLLWDSLETIVPRAGWPPYRFADKASNDAVELVIVGRPPKHDEMVAAQTALNKLLDSGEVARIIASAPRDLHRTPYLIYPEKFTRETWSLLMQGGMAQWVEQERDYGVPPALGFLMMSLLADACAGTQIQKITDKVEAYSWLADSHAQTLNSTHVKGFDVSQVAPAHDRLVTLSLEVMDVRNVPIENLVAFRKREAKTGGADYSAMRRRYSAALQAHIKRICSEAHNKSDVRELEKQFKADLSADLADLKSELRLASIKTLFSKEVAVSAVLSAGALINPIAGVTELSTQLGLVGVVPLLKAAVDLKGARRTTLTKHTSSWLYLVKGRGGFQLA